MSRCANVISVGTCMLRCCAGRKTRFAGKRETTREDCMQPLSGSLLLLFLVSTFWTDSLPGIAHLASKIRELSPIASFADQMRPVIIYRLPRFPAFASSFWTAAALKSEVTQLMHIFITARCKLHVVVHRYRIWESNFGIRKNVRAMIAYPPDTVKIACF